MLVPVRICFSTCASFRPVSFRNSFRAARYTPAKTFTNRAARNAMMVVPYLSTRRTRYGIRKVHSPSRNKRSAKKRMLVTNRLFGSMWNPPYRRQRCPLRAPFLSRYIFLDRRRIETLLIVARRMLEVSNRTGTDFPYTALHAGVVLVPVALQSALDFDVSALVERLGRLRKPAVGDDAVPFRVRHKLTRQSVPVRAFCGQREHGEGRLIGVDV